MTPVEQSPKPAVWAVIAAAILFGTAGAMTTWLAPDAWPPSVAATRLAVGAAGLMAVVVIRSMTPQVGQLLRRLPIWLMGGAIASYQVFFFVAVRQSSVTVAALVTIGSAPVFAGVLWWLLGEGLPGWEWMVLTAVGITGLGFLTGVIGTPIDVGPTFVWGALAALVAGLSYAGYTAAGVRLSRAGHDGTVTVAAGFGIAAVAISPALWLASPWVWSAQGLMVALWIGLGATTLAYLFFAVALPVLRPATIATLTLAEPLTATALGVFLLDERLTYWQWAGAALLLTSLVGVGRVASRGGQPPPAPRSA